MTIPANPFTLADWRRQVAELYATVRHHASPEAAWYEFRRRRDALFAAHPQSPLTDAQRVRFSGLPYFPYNPAWRVAATIDPDVPHDTLHVRLPADGDFRYSRVARLRFFVGDVVASLSVFWIEGYGGGLFLPFRDTTCGQTSYGGGRYLVDSIKGADLSPRADTFVLDFNFAYNPSCAYNAQWVCPLSSPENTLPFAVEAGEQGFDDGP